MKDLNIKFGPVQEMKVRCCICGTAVPISESIEAGTPNLSNFSFTWKRQCYNCAFPKPRIPLPAAVAIIILFIIAGLVGSGCSDNITAPVVSGAKPLYTLDSLVIWSRDTGSVNVSNLARWSPPPALRTGVEVSFTGKVTHYYPGDVKYISVTTIHSGTLTYHFAKYGDEINGAHLLTINIPFDELTFYIKIFDNHHTPAFVKLTNIKVKAQ